MNRFNIFFENSPFWIVPAIAVAALMTFLLYRHATTFSDNIKKLLSILRFVLLTILLILLISPVIRQIINHYEKPVLVIAIDNSYSVTAVEDSADVIENINMLSRSLDDKYAIEYRTLTGKASDPENINFSALTTDLNSMFDNINNDYENRNIAAVVLMSDGLFNQGFNPTYAEYAYPVYTVGFGDTTTYSDIGIQQLRYNKLSYQGNKIPIQADISYEGIDDLSATISIIHNGQTLAERTISFTESRGIHTEIFHIDATNKGLQRYEVVLSELPDEKNVSNNVKSAFIDIVEGKKNILLLAPSPHPDIKALRSAITASENYEFIQYIPGINDHQADQLINTPVDLVIFHHLPNQKLINNNIWNHFSEAEVSKWWITGTRIHFSYFNQLNNTIQIDPVGRQTDNVTAYFNPNFNVFNLSEDIKSIFSTLPPVNVPFGEYQAAAGANIFLYQQVGRVQTGKLLFAMSSIDGVREGVFPGDGLWKWRLYEYAQFQTHDRFNELVSKTVQYLSTREDKRKFRFYPVKNEFNEGEQVIFESEVYNELYEPIYNQQINLKLTNTEDSTRSYQYVPSENNTRYAISGLPPGIYKYEAQTTFNRQTMDASGEFAVISLNLETLNLTANYELLNRLSNNSGGNFYTSGNTESLVSTLNDQEFKDRIQTTEDFLPLINIKWIGILLLLLISFEWITRKYHGAY